MSLLLQPNSDVSPLIRSVFIYHKHNRRVLTNRVRQQVLLKRRKSPTSVRINPNNRHGYNLCIPLFDSEISAVILFCNVVFEPVPKTAVSYFMYICLSVSMEQRGFTGRILVVFHIWTLGGCSLVGWSVGMLVGVLVGRSVG